MRKQLVSYTQDMYTCEFYMYMCMYTKYLGVVERSCAVGVPTLCRTPNDAIVRIKKVTFLFFVHHMDVVPSSFTPSLSPSFLPPLPPYIPPSLFPPPLSPPPLLHSLQTTPRKFAWRLACKSTSSVTSAVM